MSGKYTSSQTGLGTTTATGSYLQNTTLSTSGTKVQVSPALEFEGHVDNTTSGDVDNFARARIYYLPVTGAGPSGTFHFQGSIDTGTPSFSDAMTLTSVGSLTVGNAANYFASAGSLNVTRLAALSASSYISAIYFGSSPYSEITASGANQLQFINTSNTGPGIAATGAGDDVACYNTTSFQLTYGSTSACGVSLSIYKENFTPIQNALATIMEMQPGEFDWRKDSGYHPNPTLGMHDTGMYADNLAAINPQFGAYNSVTGELRNFRDRVVLTYAVGAIQDEQQEIEQLKARLSVLESHTGNQQ